MTSIGSPTPGSPAANRPLSPPVAVAVAVADAGPHEPDRPRPRSRRRRAAGVLAGSLLAASVVAGLGGAAHAELDARVAPEKAARIWLCDPSGCLFAWRVVDSDGDGVSDADELVAGTDPHRADRTPLLRDLVDIAAARGLPSFEAGLAAFVVLPPELVALREKAEGDRLDAFQIEGFPVAGRDDALKRLGIDEGQMKEMGIDIGRTGFTIGLDALGTDDGGHPPVRIGGITRDMISNDDGKDHEPTTPATTPAPPTPPASTPPVTAAPEGGSGTDGGTDAGAGGGAGAADDELTPLPRIDPHGIAFTTEVDGVRIIVFNNGDQFGWGPGFTWAQDKGEKEPTIWPDYTNPDADEPTGPTPEQLEAWERTVGAATRTVEGWRTPVADGEPLPRSTYALIAYIESDLATTVMLDEPRITTAQPEVRPDLPDPGSRAGGGIEGGGGDGRGCAVGLCAG